MLRKLVGYRSIFLFPILMPLGMDCLNHHFMLSELVSFHCRYFFFAISQIIV